MKKFFKNFLFWGVIVTLIGVIFDLVIAKYWDNATFILLCNIISNVFLTVGVGLIVGYIMDMTKNNDTFIEYIQNRIKSVVISKDFIRKLSSEEKQKIVEQCLLEDNIHDKMIQYVKYKTEKLSKLSNGNLRSNIDYTTTASKKNGKVLLHTVMSYRIYKVNNTYQNIEHIFDKPTSKVLEMSIINSKKKFYKIDQALLKNTPYVINENDTLYINSVEVPSHLKNENSLSLKILVEEEGYDHWAHLVWMSLYPTDTITYKIICKDGLIIKEHFIFDDQKGLYYTHKEKDDNGNITEYTISCDEWTDPYTGFLLIISEP